MRSVPSRRIFARGALACWLLRGTGVLGFLVSKFPGFLVSEIIGFKVSKLYQNSISCSLEDIDPVSKIFKNVLNGSSGFFGARLVQVFLILDVRSFEIYEHTFQN